MQGTASDNEIKRKSFFWVNENEKGTFSNEKSQKLNERSKSLKSIDSRRFAEFWFVSSQEGGWGEVGH